MAKMTLDLTDYKPAFGDRIDDGRYIAKVTSVELKKSKNTDMKMALVWFEIVSGAFEGKALQTNLMLEGKGVFRTVEFLSAIGYKTPREVLNFDTDRWIGKPIILDVKSVENEYNGNTTTRSEIQTMLRATPELVKTMRAAGGLAKAEEPAADYDEPVAEEAEDEKSEPKAAEKKAEPKQKKAEPETEAVEDEMEEDEIDLDELTSL